MVLGSQLDSPSITRGNNKSDIQNILSRTAPGQLEGSSIFTSNLEYDTTGASTTGAHSPSNRRISLADDPWSAVERQDGRASSPSPSLGQGSPSSHLDWQQHESMELSPQRGERGASAFMMSSEKKNLSKKKPLVSLRTIAGLDDKLR